MLDVSGLIVGVIYQWSFGGIIIGNGVMVNVVEEGVYILMVMDVLGCVVVVILNLVILDVDI